MSRLCIESALQAEPNAEILAIDDCSTDSTIQEMLGEIYDRFPDRFRWDRNVTNLGFVETANKGMEQAGDRHVVLLNSDTISTPSFASIMCTAFSNGSRVASVTPMTNAGTIANIPSMSSDLLIESNTFSSAAAKVLSGAKSFHKIESWPEIPTAVGFAMAINGRLRSQIGLFDPIFSPGYGEENDWSFKARKLGFKNILCPVAYVHHAHGASFGSQKKILIENHLAILAQRYPKYHSDIQRFLKKDPLHYYRHWALLATFSHSSLLKIRIVIDHYSGGGATSTLESEIESQHDTLQIIVTKVSESSIEFQLIFVGFEKILYSGRRTDFDFLLTLLNPFSCLINSTPFISKDDSLIDFLTNLTARASAVELRIHDYHSICPSFNLINERGIFCEIPDIPTCDKCLPKNGFKQPQTVLSITEWRRAWSEVFKNVTTITGFSSESINRVVNIYPSANASVKQQSHDVIDYSYTLTRPSRVNSKSLVIATVGNLNHAKGSQEVIGLGEAISKTRRSHVVEHFGQIGGYLPLGLPIRVHGKYSGARDLIQQLSQVKPDIIFIPSIWPETFNLVSEELKNSGIPVLMFKMGAPFERLKERQNFIFTEYKSPSELLDFIESQLHK